MAGNTNSNKWIADLIKSFVEESIDNRLGGKYDDEKAWDTALVGFSSGNDELYYFFKEDIGDFYLTPHEIFTMTYPEISVKPQELSVISWILPQTEITKEEQRKDKKYPTERATLARVYGDTFNKKIGEYVVNALSQKGYEALSPMLSPLWENKKSQKYGYASNWSERHTAYVCGLGTFGLSDGLITPVGKAMRCGSVIAKIDLEPTRRNYTNHHEYCLYYKNGSCRKCIERCPADAISNKGHDKQKCRAYQRNVAGEYIDEKYGLDSRYCGICQFGIPCESRIP